MTRFSNEYDVTRNVRTTDPVAVNREVDRIFRDLYSGSSTRVLDQAFADVTRLFSGEYPGYHACDTAYHDVQHVLCVTLAMARLVDGYERSRSGTPTFGDALYRLGVITALFHDVGYLRKLKDHAHRNGAEYTRTHVSRGARFLKRYLPTIGMADLAGIAAELIHLTGYEKPVGKIKVPSLLHRLLGSMLGSADIISQMADRCYLEKCRDRLYPEFVLGGIATKRTPEGAEQVLFASGTDLIMKTPAFFKGAIKRLNVDLGGCYTYAQRHFGGRNLYIEEVNKNIRFAQGLSADGESWALKRNPPKTLAQTSSPKNP